MPVRLRLARHGKKTRPYYYIVATDSRAPRDGKYIERIGTYNPVAKPASIQINFDKALSWLIKGAQPSETVRSILRNEGILYKNHLLKGVQKGAMTAEQAEEKFQAWLAENQSKIHSETSKQEADRRAEAKARLAAETKVKEARAAEVAKKRAAESAVAEEPAETEEAPVAESEEAPVESSEEKAE